MSQKGADFKSIMEAVAIHYDQKIQGGSAPKIIASGKGFTAEKILQVAKELDIPLYEDPGLVEVLGKLDIGSEIPEDLYQAVARVLAFVYRANKKRGEE